MGRLTRRLWAKNVEFHRFRLITATLAAHTRPVAGLSGATVVLASRQDQNGPWSCRVARKMYDFGPQKEDFGPILPPKIDTL